MKRTPRWAYSNLTVDRHLFLGRGILANCRSGNQSLTSSNAFAGDMAKSPIVCCGTDAPSPSHTNTPRAAVSIALSCTGSHVRYASEMFRRTRL